MTKEEYEKTAKYLRKEQHILIAEVYADEEISMDACIGIKHKINYSFNEIIGKLSNKVA